MINKTIFTEDFLLKSENARVLYHNYAKNLPIIDYHNHLLPEHIAENKQFDDLTEIWLDGDHYKWRAMRALGLNEDLITGNASNHDKFMAWANIVPSMVRNPLFHWTHLELKNPFNVHDYLNKDTAGDIYKSVNEQLRQEKFSTQGLINHFKVEMLGTTDNPCFNLEHHENIAKQGLSFKVKPTFRPDRLLNIQDAELFKKSVDQLVDITGIEINSISSLLEVLTLRVNYFEQQGCSISDQAFGNLPSSFELTLKEEQEFSTFLKTEGAHFSNPDAFCGFFLVELCKLYHKKGWVQQFHIGALRNTNKAMFNKLGADSGFDSIGDNRHAEKLAALLSHLNFTDQLAKTIVYNLNPADNEVFAAMMNNFSDGGVKGKMQFGSGWWFLDQKDGIEKQLNTLSQLGILSTFIGMLTDSRSFLSFSRHEYFRRILCNLLGEDMKNGLIPNDEVWIGQVVQDICYYNAKNYFSI